MPTFKTMAALVQQAIVELRLESGPSVQNYAEDVLARKIQRIFNAIFTEYWVPNFYAPGEVMTLDGTTGKVTADLSLKIKGAEDIRYIFYANERRPLNRAPEVFNPEGMTGGYRRYWQPIGNDVQVFRVLPINTVGNITVHYRTRPDEYTANDLIRMDADLLVAGAVYDYLVDDAENELAIKKWEGIYNKRESQLRQAMQAGPIPFGAAAYDPMTEWMTQP